MPDLTDQGNALVAWLTTNGAPARDRRRSCSGSPIGGRARPSTGSWSGSSTPRPTTLGDDSVRRLEIDKRVETIEDLVSKVLRALVVFALVAVIFGIFDLWPIFAGLGLLLAAITLAGQDIVLDYLMGVLILVEGQYFKGDIIRVGAVEGTVEEVGLRRTVIRDPRGTLHSISNGLIRASANRTRSYAMAVVEIEGIADGDVERVIGVLDAVGAAAVQVSGAIEAPAGHTRLRRHDPTVRLWRHASDDRPGPAGAPGRRGSGVAPARGGRIGRGRGRADPARGRPGAFRGDVPGSAAGALNAARSDRRRDAAEPVRRPRRDC